MFYGCIIARLKLSIRLGLKRTGLACGLTIFMRIFCRLTRDIFLGFLITPSVFLCHSLDFDIAAVDANPRHAVKTPLTIIRIFTVFGANTPSTEAIAPTVICRNPSNLVV